MATYTGHNEDSSGNILLSIGNGMTATVETGTTASQAYTKGSYLFFNNRLCKATSAISSGATLAIGTNLSQTSIGQEITNHLRASNGDEFYFDYKDSKPGYYPSASKVASQFVPFGGTNQAKYVMAITNGYCAVYDIENDALVTPVNGIYADTFKVVQGSTNITVTAYRDITIAWTHGLGRVNYNPGYSPGKVTIAANQSNNQLVINAGYVIMF